jgi:hypothetical protein
MASGSSEVGRVWLHVYESPTGWRWGILAANGRSIAHGGQGYTDLRDLWAALRRVIDRPDHEVEGTEPLMLECRRHRRSVHAEDRCRVWELS